MPRFLFHIKQFDMITFDQEGMEFLDLGAATADAELALLEIAAESFRAGSPLDVISLIICDIDGNALAEVISEDVLRKFFP